jgi:hypothetical protein
MIEKNYQGFTVYLNEEKTDVVDFKVYYADADYRSPNKRVAVSVTRAKLEYKENGLVIRSFSPYEDSNYNVVVEKLERKNQKRVDYFR